MPSRAARRLFTYIVLPTAAASYGIHRGLSHLEATYPELPVDKTTSVALRTPSNPEKQRCAYIDVYSARIPLAALQARTRGNETSKKIALEDAWARSVLGSKPLRSEASVVGLMRHGRYSPGDIGDSESGFSAEGNGSTPTPRALLNGVVTVQRAPEPRNADSNGLLIAWFMPPEPREFFESIARWGYPWRLMSGGRHELSVSEPFDVPEQRDTMVEVRFSTAHDYEVVLEEGEYQKVIPQWVMRLHRGWARLILDMAAREVRRGVEN
ncbi:hypothetical protein N7510_000683 [Penicillium lagena]|uniref:uncharacterized protein n=1 Tax=Penicillium lagena TaxID=94218 RepID=UPI0025404C36|nr:uncharacterized protein N7510_000683 [Penicillium lagena]KAJ5624374.1 hypothetical protein N7510_000683 [Penicillium lagena]